MVSSALLYLGFLTLLALERCAELFISRRNANWALMRGAREVGQAHYKVMAAMHTAFLFACALEVVLLRRPFESWLGLPALGFAVAAQSLRYWAIASLGRRWNTRIIVFPNASPVKSGPYRWLRHPNYVAVALELLVVPLIHGAWITSLFFSACNVWMFAVRIPAEEEALGREYLSAFGRTPRFVPRSPP